MMKFDLKIATLILIMIVAILYLYYIDTIEKFETYSYGPFNYMDSGSDPLTFYRYPIYRNPYMYPYKFYSSYPYPYMKNYETNI